MRNFLMSLSVATACAAPCVASAFDTTLPEVPIGRVLIVTSGVDYVSLKGGGRHPTGYFLSEFGIPLEGLLSAGYEVVIANPNGSTPVMDAVSDSPMWFESEDTYLHVRGQVEDVLATHSIRTLATIKEAELATFDAIFLPGGHAPMEDLLHDAQLGRILRYFHAQNKPTALICHAPVALLSAAVGQSAWVYRGYAMTVFSTPEEQEEENSGRLGGYLTYYVADALETNGASVNVAAPWTGNVVVDRELITGQNPMSDHFVRDELLKALARRAVGQSLSGALR